MTNTGDSSTEEFCRDAVEVLQSSGRPISQIARELGINVNSLRARRNRIVGQSAGEIPGAVGARDLSGESADDLQGEIQKLRKENEYLRRQREILEKAAS
ncbi:MAG: transposase [Verrucomicrobiales bacterium]